MQGILPNTKGTAFNTKDASTIAKAANNNSGTDATDIWDSVQKGIDNAGKSFNNAANTVKSWWNSIMN
jgi:penicillin-binding protein 2A